MKRSNVALASLTAIAISGAALAADLPSRKEPPVLAPPPVLINWSGFYVGLNAGYSWSASNSVNTLGLPAFSNTSGLNNAGAAAIMNSLAALNTSTIATGNQGGFLLGGQLGYNYQMGSLLAGVETDIAGIFGSATSAAIPTVQSLAPFGYPRESWTGIASASKKVDWLGTLRGRLGFIPAPAFLLYVTGGMAYGGVQASYSSFQQESAGPAVYPPLFGIGAYSGTRVGYTLGAGAEWMFAQNWSAKLEYLYYDLGSATFSAGPLIQTTVGIPWGAAAPQSATRFNGHVVRAGVNYHFNFGGAAPVVAKY